MVKAKFPDCTTVVSYSDPSQGHTGALYRACGWKWAPTWHRIVTPPTGNGSWKKGKQESAKDQWICQIRRDPYRSEVLVIDESYAKRFPWSVYNEKTGANWKQMEAE